MGTILLNFCKKKNWLAALAGFLRCAEVDIKNILCF